MGCAVGCTVVWTVTLEDERVGGVGERLRGWTDGWVGGWTGGWTVGWTVVREGERVGGYVDG